MFLSTLKQLKAQPNVLVTQYQTYYIIRAKHKNKDGTQTDVFYALQSKDHLGSGTWGKVYKGQKINPQTGELEPNKFYAIKVLNNTKTDKSKMEKEIAAQSTYYPTEQPIIAGNDTYIITEYLPGKNMSDRRIINDLRALSFSEKTAAITQLLLQIDLLRKKNKVHRDMHAGNVMVGKEEITTPQGVQKTRPLVSLIDYGELIDLNVEEEFVLMSIDANEKITIDPKTQKITFANQQILQQINKASYDGNSDWTCPVLIKHGSNVYVFGRLPKDNPNSENLNDWGFNKLSNNTGITFPAPTSQPIKIKKSTLPSAVTEEIATKKYHVKYDGIKYYAYPPETAQGQYSLKTDIYTAVDRITQIFNAEDSQKLIAFEATSPDKTQKAITTQCTLNNSVQFPNPGNNLNLKDLTQKFLNRMQDNDPEKRPYSDEALRFFTTLHILCLACETNNQLHQIYLQEVKNTYCAKLILLANGYWTQKINSTNPSTKTAQTIDQTFENYDFASHPEVCNAIIQLFTSNLLTKDIAILIAQNTEQAENLARTINILSNYKHLSKDILTFVTQNTENAKSLIKVITTLDKKGLLTPAITTQLLGSLIPALAQTKLTYTANNFLRALFLVCNSNNPLLLNKEMIDKMWANYNSIDGNTLSEDAAKLFIFKCAYVLDYKKHSYNRSSFFSKTKHKNSTEDVSTLNVTMDTITQQAAKKPRSRTASIWKQLPATRLAQATITIKPPFNLLAVVPEA